MTLQVMVCGQAASAAWLQPAHEAIIDRASICQAAAVRLGSLLFAVMLLQQAMAPAIAQPPDASRTTDRTTTSQDEAKSPEKPTRSSAILAGGCFWCVESDFEKAPGVVDVISGYSGGRTKNPTYDTYASGGHREVVLVVYDPLKVTYAGLVEWLIKHIDPTDRRGSFKDRGVQYSPAIYYETQEQKQAAERVMAAINEMNIYRGRVAIPLKPREPFWRAEEYHQDYHSKNTFKYRSYRYLTGRDAFVNRHWGQRAHRLELPGSIPESAEADGEDSYSSQQPDAGLQGARLDQPQTLVSDTSSDSQTPATEQTEEASSEDGKPSEKPEKAWLDFQKPSARELRQKLSSIQFEVTQRDGTEPAFRNKYWDNKQPGIYVDVVSGEPLFSSTDKYKSGTGWPSFVKPIDPRMVTYHQDRGFFTVRTEVRSRIADSHLGHVFNDGPPQRGGKRFCMNSAALRFVPKEKMEEEGYGEYLKFVD